MTRLVAIIMALSIGGPACSHDSWINKGGFKSKVGEYCCGEGDCFSIPARSVSETVRGYVLFGVETVPYSESQPSPDGAYWRCKRPDGTRRCFFAPPPGS